MVVTPNEQQEYGHRLFKRAFLFLFGLFFIFGIYWLGYERGGGGNSSGERAVLAPDDAIITNKQSADNTIDFSLFWKVWEILKNRYVAKSELDARQLFYGAIDGMLAATGDPYTTFLSPEESREFSEDMSGTFEGIGAEMGMKDDIITVIAPIEGMPAEQAGLLAGDKIIKIDDVLSSTYSLDQAVKQIRGAKGTVVKLTIFREGEEETRDFSITRGLIFVKSVRLEWKDDGIAYIRVSRFGDDTEREFQSSIKEIVVKKPKGLILDMRNNPGGFLETAVLMAGAMLPAGKVVVIEEDGKGKRKEDKARGNNELGTLPTVVLINQGSASASEILAGALRDHRSDVVLVGKKSFGKGSVQELVSLDQDTAVKITIARWLTPAGEQIHNVGIVPDVEVGITSDDIKEKRDPQLDTAVEEVKKLISKT